MSIFASKMKWGFPILVRFTSSLNATINSSSSSIQPNSNGRNENQLSGRNRDEYALHDACEKGMLDLAKGLLQDARIASICLDPFPLPAPSIS